MRKCAGFLAILLVYFICTLFLPTRRVSYAQNAAKKLFTYEQAFGLSASDTGIPRDDQIEREPPQIIGWLDEERYLESRLQPGNSYRKVYAVSAVDGSAQVYLDYNEIQKSLPSGVGADSPAASDPALTRLVFSHDGDLYFYETVGRRSRRLTATAELEQNPRFSPDGRWIAYTRSNNLFAYDLENGVEHQYTTDGSETISNGWASWVYYEEILGRPSHYAAFWWSPDSKLLAFLRFDDTPVPIFPIYHAEGAHGRLENQRYPKAGDSNPYVSVGIASVAGNQIRWMDFPDKADHYLAWPFWTADSKSLTVQWMNRRQDDIRLFNCSPLTGEKVQIFEEKQATWVNFFEDLYNFKNGSGFLLRSDADGWDHLYYYGNDGKLKKRLTSGKWRVNSIEKVDEAGGYVYFIGRPTQSWDAHLMRVKLDGTELQQLTGEAGIHQAQISPGGKYFVDTFSNLSTPSTRALYTGKGKLVRRLGETQDSLMNEYFWGKAELFTIPSGDGFELPAFWVLPVDFNPNRQYPVIFNVYGGPDAGTVQNKWLGVTAHYWAQRGVISISVDHRGSGHFGKTGMNFLYRNLGKWEMHDLAAAARWLRAKPFVSKDKIGIAGSSYGGYVTLLAMTQEADYFAFGQAGSPVVDWKLYDSVYTERYMSTPGDNPEGYRNASVLTGIDRYQGLLRITHGAIDDNVHLQNTLQLIERLTGSNKHFEFMLYPDSRHSISQREHLLRETHDFWMKNLLNQ